MKNKKVMEIDLKRMLLILAKRIWLILLVGAVLATAALVYVRSFVQEKYAAEVRMYVNNTYGAGTMGFSSSQMSAAQDLASTYMVILDSYDVLEEVAQVAKTQYGASKTYTVAQLRGMISTTAIDETEVFRVVVTCANKNDAVKVANAVKDVLPRVIDQVVNGEAEEKVAAPLVSLQDAEYRGKVAPNERSYMLVGFLMGAMIVAVAVVAREALDTSISSEEFLVDAYEGIPLLAVIPDAENPKGGSNYKGYYKGYYKGNYEYKKKPSADEKKGGTK